MKIYIKFITITFFKSLLFVLTIMFSLVFILNLLSELEFFKNESVDLNFTLFMSLINSPILIFDLFPFIVLITTQLFFIKFFENKEIEIFKYSGLKNSKIIYILSILSIITGIFIITIFYNLSSNLKNIYLEIKSTYTTDGKYLAVITKNGLWIKDKIADKIIITNASAINQNFLKNVFITEFDENYKKLNSSTTEVDMYLLKLISYPVYLLLIALFSSVIMLNIKQIRGTTIKISIGLFLSVIIYYLNNFSYVLGSTERISIISSILLPLLILILINCLTLYKINEK